MANQRYISKKSSGIFSPWQTVQQKSDKNWYFADNTQVPDDQPILKASTKIKKARGFFGNLFSSKNKHNN